MKTPYLLAGAVCLAMSLVSRAAEIPVAPPGTSSRIDQIKQRGSLRVGVLDEYPWLKRNAEAGGKPFAGPAWRLAEEYANRLGVKLETIPVAERVAEGGQYTRS
jgi:polar amino acid transport system substrate-binding protein